MHNSGRLSGLALLVFTVGTFGAFSLTKTPAGDFDLAGIHRYLAASSRVPIIGGAFLGLVAGAALLIYMSSLRADLPSGRARDVVWGAGIAAAASAAIGWTIAAALPVALAQGGGKVSLPPSIVYMTSIIAVLMVYGPAMFFTGIGLLVSAHQLQVAPRWWRGLTYAGGVCAILSAAFFPFYLFILYGVVIGAWGIAMGDRRVTTARERMAAGIS